jgi:hypothetical protein
MYPESSVPFWHLWSIFDYVLELCPNGDLGSLLKKVAHHTSQQAHAFTRWGGFRKNVLAFTLEKSLTHWNICTKKVKYDFLVAENYAGIVHRDLKPGWTQWNFSNCGRKCVAQCFYARKIDWFWNKQNPWQGPQRYLNIRDNTVERHTACNFWECRSEKRFLLWNRRIRLTRVIGWKQPLRFKKVAYDHDHRHHYP